MHISLRPLSDCGPALLTNASSRVQCQPTFISLFSYCAFWFIVIVIIVIKWRRGSLTDAEYKRKRREAQRRKKLGLPPLTAEEEEKMAVAEEVRFCCLQSPISTNLLLCFRLTNMRYSVMCASISCSDLVRLRCRK